ncbi:hypothetical protein L207DRAFT_419257 [Hyaloscypha variabilis F]|uniref:HIT-type domain-containing protein n=1 Tax=Hyaloscypha variabilis (strain UAMH 11265 / GT02V1 / F) TaxID=1149755 RepID=A0A2J6S2Q4_HYAVF|nr:hypothetical protein L207DRAFT_419257 [Hyaloscypha variabilis F]
MDLPDTKTGPDPADSSTDATTGEDVPNQQEESSLAEADVPNNKLCGVCNKKEWKYKCTRCYLPSCSLVCSTVHKATHPALEAKPAETIPESKPQSCAANPRPGTVAAAGFKGPFAALDHSKELRLLFKVYPKLPALLNEINAATLRPLEEVDDLPQNGYVKGKKEQPWTFDRGLEKGREALNRARDRDEGVREYSKLILQILSGDAGISAAEMVEKELREENSKIIETLLQGEL